jgi:Spy/CpxP family protein refolding chaperone
MSNTLIKMILAGLSAVLVLNLGITVSLWNRLSAMSSETKQLKERLAELELPARHPIGDASVNRLRDLRSALFHQREPRREETDIPPKADSPEQNHVAHLEADAMAAFAQMNDESRGKTSGKGRIPLEQLAADLELTPRQTSDLKDIINEARKGLHELYQSAQKREKVPYVRRIHELGKKTYGDLQLILTPQQYEKLTSKGLGLFAVETGYRPFAKQK